MFYTTDHNMALPKGRTNNPNGRPPKSRTLTALLEKAGDQKVVDVDGNEIPAKQLVSRYLWEALTTGSVLLPSGHAMHFDGSEWAALAFKVLAQVDGPPKAEVDVTSGGEALTFTIDIDRPNGGQSDA